MCDYGAETCFELSTTPPLGQTDDRTCDASWSRYRAMDSAVSCQILVQPWSVDFDVVVLLTYWPPEKLSRGLRVQFSTLPRAFVLKFAERTACILPYKPWLI